jgi:hypothetical protein
MSEERNNCSMAEKDAEIQRLRGALAWVYDKWENGDSCYEDPDDYSGYMGRAFKIESEEESIILDLIGEFEAALPPKRERDLQADSIRKGRRT